MVIMEASFEEKLNRAYDLSCSLVFNEDNSLKNIEHIPTDIQDLIWGYIDSLIQQYHLNRINGRCSLKAMLDYDMENEEKKLDEQILLLKSLK